VPSSWLQNAYRTLREIESNQQIRRWVSVGVFLCTVAFLVFILLRSTDELRELDDWPTYLGVCARGFLLYPISLIVQALIWRMMIMRLGQTAGGWWDIEIYAYSSLMRHLPGMIWYLAGRATMYHTRGVGAGVALMASGLEWILLLAAAVLVYGTLSLTGSGMLLISIVLLSALIVATALALRQALLASTRLPVPGFIRRRLTALATAPVPGAADLTLWLSLYVLTYFVAGWILLVVVRGVAPEVTMGLDTATKIWAVTGGIGSLLSAIVPAGLGVRELTLTVLLSPPMSMAGAIVVAILLRMLYVGGSLIWGGMLWAIARLIRRHRPENTSNGLLTN
jgi:hypothetical protein